MLAISSIPVYMIIIQNLGSVSIRLKRGLVDDLGETAGLISFRLGWQTIGLQEAAVETLVDLKGLGQ